MADEADVNIHRTIGRIEGRLDGFDTRLQTIENGMKSQDTKLDTLVNRANVEKGARKLVWGVGAFAAGFTAIAGEVVHWLRGT